MLEAFYKYKKNRENFEFMSSLVDVFQIEKTYMYITYIPTYIFLVEIYNKFI